MKSRVAVVCASPLVALFAFNCSVPSFCEGSECAAVDGGGDGDVVVGPHDASSDGPVTDGSKLPDGAMADGATEAGPPVCDKSADPKDSPACVVDADGVFVDAAGLDTNAGTKEAPVKTITKAVALARGGVGRVYVCAGSYPETVSLTAAVSVYGGFACGTYAYSGALPVVTGSAGNSALTITGVTGVTVEDMQFVSVDATGTDASGNGNSSIAAFISSSTGVTIKRSTFKAGAGAAAALGLTTGTTFAAAAAGGVTGTGGASGPGGTAVPNTCTNGSGTSASGKGGMAIDNGNNGGPGSATPTISPAYPADGNHDGAKGTDCGSGSAHAGSYGLGGGGGVSAPAVGVLSATSWSASSGGAGMPGGVGEGGGGGASTDNTGGGGSGSPGGCGGDGGKGGAGGGASLGIAVYASMLNLTDTTIQTATAGTGGSGSKGGTAQGVSAPGGAGSLTACAGALGGYGGSGGGGAGGTGGPSVGIMWTGTAPNIDGSATNMASQLPGITVSPSPAAGGGQGSGGDAVAGGARGGQPGATGTAGISQAVLGV